MKPQERQLRMLDLFCGRLGWSKAFLARGWKVTAVDLVEPPEIPEGVRFEKRDILCIGLGWDWERYARQFDFICASSPCEQFSVFGMKNFHPNPPYPEAGIRLFNHTRALCETSGKPYVMENVRAAQQFVGKAAHRCGPFYLWGNGVPMLMPQGITKGLHIGCGKAAREFLARGDREGLKAYRKEKAPCVRCASKIRERKEQTAKAAEIPPELANCVADYAERLLESGAAGIQAQLVRSGLNSGKGE